MNLRQLIDHAWLLIALVFSFRPSGPMSVIGLGAYFAHLHGGYPRFQFWAANCITVPFLLRGLILNGLSNDTFLPSTLLAPILILLGTAVSLCLDVLIPIGDRLPRPRGEHKVACQLVRVQNATHGADATVRFYLPARVHEAAAARLPYILNVTDGAASGYATFMKWPTAGPISWMEHVPGKVWDAHPRYARPPAAGGPFPIFIFSHGLGGTPDCYSVLIADLVSSGWVVAAVEHNDGSAAFTRVDDVPRAYEHPPPAYFEETPAAREQIYGHRNRQLKDRVGEVRATMDLVERLARGRPEGWSREDSAAAKERDDMTILWDLLGGRLEPARMLIGGHSFGACTAIATAYADARPKAVVALDPWYFPLHAHILRHGLDHVPILSICGDHFSNWDENSEAQKVLFSREYRAHLYKPLNGKGADGTATASTQSPSSSATKRSQGNNDKSSNSKSGVARSNEEEEEEGEEEEMDDDGDADDDLIKIYEAQAAALGAKNPKASARAAVRMNKTDFDLRASSSSDILTSSSIPQNGIAHDGEIHEVLLSPGGLAHPRVHPDNVLLTLRNAEHQNFNDFSLLLEPAMRFVKLIGSAPASSALQAISSAVLAFSNAKVAEPGSPEAAFTLPTTPGISFSTEEWAMKISPAAEAAAASPFAASSSPAAKKKKAAKA